MGHDAVDDLGVLAGEPVGEEGALAVPVDVHLPYGQDPPEGGDEIGDVVAVRLALDEVERVPLSRGHAFRGDDDVFPRKLPAAIG